MEEIWIRKCPNCKKDIIHTYKYSYITGIKKNKICLICRNRRTGKKRKGKNLTQEHKNKIRKSMFGKISSKTHPERSKKISISNIGKKHGGRKKIPRIKEKCLECNNEFEIEQWRKSAHFCSNICKKEYYHKNKIWKPRFNPKACELIEEYGKQNGYNFQHALNGGEYYIKELKYFVDGYDKEKNVVIEYNEKYHNLPKQRKIDEVREKKITDYLKCKFIKLYE